MSGMQIFLGYILPISYQIIWRDYWFKNYSLTCRLEPIIENKINNMVSSKVRHLKLSFPASARVFDYVEGWDLVFPSCCTWWSYWQVCSCCREHFSYYKANDDRWKNSVRHNLSINPHFRKGSKAPHGAGHLWTVATKEPLSPYSLVTNIYHNCFLLIFFSLH